MDEGELVRGRIVALETERDDLATELEERGVRLADVHETISQLATDLEELKDVTDAVIRDHRVYHTALTRIATAPWPYGDRQERLCPSCTRPRGADHHESCAWQIATAALGGSV